MNRLLLPLVITLLGFLSCQGTGKQLPLPGKSFQVQGHTAFLILPKQPRKQKTPTPWVWYAPTLSNLPGKEERWMFKLWLDQGIAIAGIDVGNLTAAQPAANSTTLFIKPWWLIMVWPLEPASSAGVAEA